MGGKSKSLVPIKQIDGMIHTIRGVRVMLDRDLAHIYGVPTKVFNLSLKQSTESQEVSGVMVLDYDAEGDLVRIDIDHASRKLNLREFVTSYIPLEAEAQS